MLNSRDAWSKLIISYANNNINFNKTCFNHEQKYEVLDGMSSDGSISNFLQLIKNLLRIENWSDIKNNNIKKINNLINSTNGIGKIEITYKILPIQIDEVDGTDRADEEDNIIIIHCNRGHYYMSHKIKPLTQIEYESSSRSFTQDKEKIIEYLTKKTFSVDNYLWIKWDSELLAEKINDTSIIIELKKKLLDLSFTDQYDSDTRRRIILDVDQNDLFEYFIKKFKDDPKINEFTYKSNDFRFVNELPKLLHLNSEIKDKNQESIDLTPLKNITSIGDGFMNNCIKLKEINLSFLSNITSIGNNFMLGCKVLQEINLSFLSNIVSIGFNFMSNCTELKNINLSGLSNLKSINDNFMFFCANLESINLSSSTNLIFIGKKFMAMCKALKTIDLSGSVNIKSISDEFAIQCIKIVTIKLPLFSNITSIGHSFMWGCESIKNIHLTSLINLKSIGNEFMNYCFSLVSIDLSGLINLESIGNYFMNYCKELKEIDLTPLKNLKSIGDDFLHNCKELKEIDLTPLTNLKSIGDTSW